MEIDKSIKEQIYYLEELLLQPNIRNSYNDLNELLAEDFIEFGSTGRIYNKKASVEGMLGEQDIFDTEIKDFEIKLLASDVILATYKIRIKNDTKQWEKFSLRSSIWEFEDEKWQLFFHQGTLTQEF